MSLSGADLAAMQATAAAFLPEMATATRSGATVATVAGRVGPATAADERLLGERVTAVVTCVVTLPAGTDVRATDRIAVGTRIFQVVAPLAPRSWELVRRVACVEVL